MTDWVGVEAGAKSLFGIEPGALVETGGGGGGTPNRVANDAALNYYNFSGIDASSVPNQGTGGVLALSLVTAPAGSAYHAPGEFGEDAVMVPTQDSNGFLGVVLKSAGTTKGEAASITADCWVFVVRATTYPGAMPIVGKMHTAGVGDYSPSAMLFYFQDGTIEAIAQWSDGGTPTYITVDSSPLAVGGWHHIGLTFTSSTLTLYVDGAAVGTTTGGPIDWGTHGEVCLLGWTGVAYPNSPPIVLSDVRWATTAQPLSYFEDIYATWRNPAS